MPRRVPHRPSARPPGVRPPARRPQHGTPLLTSTPRALGLGLIIVGAAPLLIGCRTPSTESSAPSEPVPTTTAPVAAIATTPGTTVEPDGRTDEPDTVHRDAAEATPPPSIDLADDRFSPEQLEVLAVYRASIDALRAALAGPVPNPASPDLERLLLPDRLRVVQTLVTNYRDQGRFLRPAEPSEFTVYANSISIHGDDAIIESCTVDDEVVVQLGTEDQPEHVVNDWRGVSVERAQFVRTPDGWKVSYVGNVSDTLDPEATCG